MWFNLFRLKRHPNWAERIQDEMRDGTPDTPKRVETIRRADAVFAATDLSTQPPEPMWTEDADAFPVPTEAELNHQYRYKRIWEER